MVRYCMPCKVNQSTESRSVKKKKKKKYRNVTCLWSHLFQKAGFAICHVRDTVVSMN